MEQTKVIKPKTALDNLIETLHMIFDSDSVNVEEVQSIMEAYESNPDDWMKFTKFEQYSYTRNLVDEVEGKFRLMILCWSKDYKSNIHTHTDEHCFMKLLQGELSETQFECFDPKLLAGMVVKLLKDQLKEMPFESLDPNLAEKVEKLLKDQLKESPPKSLDPNLPAGMVQKAYRDLLKNQCTYISDSIGLHCVENFSKTEFAVSLHLYCPLSQAHQTSTSAPVTATPSG